MGKGKNWSRKRKAQEKSDKSDKPRKTGGWGTKDSYNVLQQGNAKFESYYSLVGLHDTRYNADSKTFVPCANDAEKHAERDLFMTTLEGILPASFRVDRSLDPTIQKKVLEELEEFVGKEMELEVELPKRTAPFGGIKNILDNGTDVVKETNADVPNDEAKKGKIEHVNAKLAADGDNANMENGPKTIVIKKIIAPAKPIPFISANGTTLGFQLSVDRRTLRRNKSLAPLHDWMKIQTASGHITRQETVSMIPPVVLNAKEGMSVLDMCAAPGSKTCQLLEVVGMVASHTGEEGKKDELEAPGYVVANDADPKRAYMLVNQLRRMNSPSVFVTSCDGQFFPILDKKSAKGTDEEGMFDRVLCDVPCSGDGTIRKNPGIWKRWNQLGSIGLHPLQLSIALRGARLTNVGGYVVYSTCSMNPMENESVVAELLRISEGSLVLEDPRGRMEGLIARPGWSTWKVLRESKNRTRRARKDWNKKNNKKMQGRRKEWEEKRLKGECPEPKEANVDESKKEAEEEEKYVPSPYDTIPYIPPATWDDAALSERTTSLGFVEYASYDDVEEEWRRSVRASCFPPTEEEVKKFELHKCLRSLPQDMDTGGFFVALLKKVKPLSKNATERMDTLVKASKGGVTVEPMKASEEKHSDNGKDSEDVTMTDSSVAEGKADNKPTNTSKDEGAKPEEESKKEEDTIQKAPTGKVGHAHTHKKKEDLSKADFIATDPSIWGPIVEEFGLAPSFPKEQFMVRASGEAKVLYFISKSIKEGLIDHGIQERVTVINSGLKGFERCSLKEKTATYRITQEGAQYVVPHMTKRILSVNMDDFYACIGEGFIPFEKFSEPFQKGLEALAPGSFIVTLKGYEKDISKKMFLVMWRRSSKSGGTVNCFVSKIEQDAILSKMRAVGFVPPKKEEVTEGVTGLVAKEEEMTSDGNKKAAVEKKKIDMSS